MTFACIQCLFNSSLLALSSVLLEKLNDDLFVTRANKAMGSRTQLLLAKGTSAISLLLILTALMKLCNNSQTCSETPVWTTLLGDLLIRNYILYFELYKFDADDETNVPSRSFNGPLSSNMLEFIRRCLLQETEGICEGVLEPCATIG